MALGALSADFISEAPQTAIFLIALIKIIEVEICAKGCLMKLDHRDGGVSQMKSEYPYTPTPGTNEQKTAPPSRLTDEKISDETGTESKADSAMAPAGLNNPFWN